ncbi:uncharacterized protein [Arachis hypogaea]|uniref:uncharacterized protein n=1 Tax=Arachis hypogaea TaxID=3818 RepID=UPI003B2199A2
MTPHETLHGFPMNLLPGYIPSTSPVVEVDSFLRTHEILNDELGFYLHQARSRMKKQADKYHRDQEFREGEWVLLKLKPYRQISLFHKEHPKLGRQFFGPYQVQQRVGKLAYRLELPASSTIHPVFHVSMLKKFHGEPPAEVPVLAGAPAAFQPLSSAIIACRTVIKEGQPVEQVLLDWEGTSRDETTWVNKEELQRMFSDLDLEDKVIVGEGIVDTVTILSPSQQLNLTREEESSDTDPIVSKRERKMPYWTRNYVMGK